MKHQAVLAERDDLQKQVVAAHKEYQRLWEDYETLSKAMADMINHVRGG